MLIAGDVVTIDSALVFVIICETRVCVVVGETVVQAVSHLHPVGVFVRQCCLNSTSTDLAQAYTRIRS